MKAATDVPRERCSEESESVLPEWCFLGMLTFEPGYGAHLVRKYALAAVTKLVNDTHARPGLLPWWIDESDDDDDDEAADRPIHVLPLLRPDLGNIVFPGSSSFDAVVGNPSACPIPGEGEAVRVLVLAPGGETLCDAATIASVERAGCFVGPGWLDRAHLCLFLRGTEYDFGFAWIGAAT